MRHMIRGVNVDAGMIMVGDKSYLTDLFPGVEIFPNRLAQIIDIDPGQYIVGWNIKNIHNGHIKGTCNLTVTSGQVFISDPCYLIRDEKWRKYLNDTDYCKNLPNNAFIIDEMGGDGSYDVALHFNKQ